MKVFFESFDDGVIKYFTPDHTVYVFSRVPPGSSRVDLQLQAWRSEQGSAWIIHPGRVSGGVVAAGSFRPGLTQEEVEEQVEVEVEVHVEAQVSHRRAPRAILQIGKVL